MHLFPKPRVHLRAGCRDLSRAVPARRCQLPQLCSSTFNLTAVNTGPGLPLRWQMPLAIAEISLVLYHLCIS